MILGINAFHADASACMVDATGLLAAVEEERFRRIKHWAGLPTESIRYCLEQAGIQDLRQCDALAVSRKPGAYFWRKVLLALGNPRSLRRSAGRLRNLQAVAGLKASLAEAFDLEESSIPPIHGVEHHVAHIGSAFLCSPYEEAMCLTVDGFGDFVSTMMAVGRGSDIEVLRRVHYPHSLGLFYTALTQFLGFMSFGDEYKVMGLAAQGEPSYLGKLREVVPTSRDGTFRLDTDYFRHLREGVDMAWEGGQPTLGLIFTSKLEELLGPSRGPGEEVSQRHKDLAASVQALYEEHLFRLVRKLQAETGLKDLCLAGGCGQNSLANGKLFEEAGIDRLFVQPAAADNGTSLGAALVAQHSLQGSPRQFTMEHAFWGPEYSDAAIDQAVATGLDSAPGGRDQFNVRRHDEMRDLAAEVARALDDGAVVGWYQGRSEWGPRALGNRSIVADPRRTDMRELLNRKIKRRESFRPFAPSVLASHAGDWFEGHAGDVFMTQVAPVRPERRDQVPAITHFDGTGRLQLVEQETNPRYWELLTAFDELTGVPMLLNTSFNENEPIVNWPEEALDCFLRTRMDLIVLGRTVVSRAPESKAS